MREISLKNGEYYHIYNRGTDKRDIFSGEFDYVRFFRSLKEFNQVEPVVSLYIKDQLEKAGKTIVAGPLQGEKLIEIVAFNLLPNHFHLILKQLREGGISEFMKRVGGGYTRYFNHRYKRSGVLFQGKFKSAHINSNEKLIYLSAYVDGNHIVHGIKNGGKFSSLDEYKNGKKYLCNVNPVLCQFDSVKDYLKYIENTTREINEVREDMKKCLIEEVCSGRTTTSVALLSLSGYFKVT